MTNVINRVAKDWLGKSIGYGRPNKETWRGNKEAQAIKERNIETYLDVESMILMKIKSGEEGSKKDCSRG